MSKIYFDAPENWVVDYEEGYEDYVDENGDYVDSVFTENLFASSKDGRESIEIIIPHDTAPVDIYEDIVPEYLTQDPKLSVCTCHICGREAYCLKEDSDTESLDFQIMFNNPEGDIVFIYVKLSSMEDEDRMIAFMTEHLSFC